MPPPKDTAGWDQALKHKCAICSGSLSSQKATRSCLGVHEEPCPKFHLTVFRMGRWTACNMCHHVVETAYRRFSEMAGYVRQIRMLDRVNESPPDRKDRRKAVNEPPPSPKSPTARWAPTLGRTQSKKERKGEKRVEKTQRNVEALTTKDSNAIFGSEKEEIRNAVVMISEGAKEPAKDLLRILQINEQGRNSQRKELFQKLYELACSHFQVCDNEKTECDKREAGYYEYAPASAQESSLARKLTFRALWATGEIVDENGKVIAAGTELDYAE